MDKRDKREFSGNSATVSSTDPSTVSSATSSAIPFTILPNGGVTSARGFKATGVQAGFYRGKNRLDLAVVCADESCAAAATFTRNIFCAAPVIVSRRNLGGRGYGTARAVLINAGNANAATGAEGLAIADKTCGIAAELFGCSSEEILVASTGVIGEYLDPALFEKGLSLAAKELAAKELAGEEAAAELGMEAVLELGVEAVSKADTKSTSEAGGHKAARAIMTTDTVPKEYALSYTSEDPGLKGMRVTVGGIAKGSGMIMPDMATMLAVFTTDAPLSPPDLHEALTQAVNRSFNKLTIDTDTSTNDCCFALASGKAVEARESGKAVEAREESLQATTSRKAPDITISRNSPAFDEFCRALEQVCIILARKMAEDGEGATRLITVNVQGAASLEDADKAARAIANSPLVKTAVYGHDANWGRIAMALGKSGACFRQERVDIDIMGIPVCRAGLAVSFSEDEAKRRFEAKEIVIDANLGAGDEKTTLWTCDYSHDYITINGDYRT